ncbi:MAG TPA: FAD-linked oxidase C-terminal domain-containing protein [Gemmatimonadaceae bacterium]
MPQAVAVARTREDVPAMVRWARHNQLPITARGSGSSMANGAVGPGLVLDVNRLNHVDPVNVAGRTIRCGAGALRDEVDQAARRHGLRFPVDPSSGSFCTVGGMVATNAAGAHSLGFGATHAWVVALDCVLADGTTANLRRGEPPGAGSPIFSRALQALERARPHAEVFRRDVRKESSGYAVARWLDTGDLLDLIVGSEGTLAIVTDVELRLVPVAADTASVLAAFSSVDAATIGAAEARHAGAVVCELLDRSFLDAGRIGSRVPGFPADAATMLLTKLEADDPGDARTRAVELENRMLASGATFTSLAVIPDAEREIWELRHAASPMLARLDPSLRSVQVVEDGAVPPAALGDYVRAVHAALARQELRGVIFGHAGDAHVHVNPLVDVSDPRWRERLIQLLEEITAATVSLGGTLTGEHGDGRLRAPLLARSWPAAAMRTFRELKDAFDPDNLLNPGVKLPLPGQLPLEAVKYDPALPQLPAVARRALDHVADSRGYATPRLSLLESES